MKNIYIVVLVLLTQINAYAKWTAVNRTDDFTDEKIKYISYKTKDSIVQIDREEKYNSLRIAIKRKEIGNISPETTVEIRVDKKKMYVAKVSYWLDVYKRANTKMTDRSAYLDNKTIIFAPMIHAFYHEGNFLCDMAKGNFLRLRYSLSDGSTESLKIPLKGITKKIKTVFGDRALMVFRDGESYMCK